MTTPHDSRTEGNFLVVSLHGDIDLSESPRARKFLLECVGRQMDVIVDLSGVSYIDSSGVASLVEALNTSRGSGVDFVLANVSEPALRVIRLALLEKVFVIHESVEAALGDGR